MDAETSAVDELSSFFAWIMMPKCNHARSRQVFVREAHKLGSGEFRKWYRLIQANPGMSGAQPATGSRPALVTPGGRPGRPLRP